MSPEIYVNGVLIARVPDETGLYSTLAGKYLYVNTDGINADAKRQTIVLAAEELGETRKLGLTLEGIGNSSDRKRGDHKDPEITVKLLGRPIRVTYSPAKLDPYSWEIYRGDRQTLKNPRWIRGHGRR